MLRTGAIVTAPLAAVALAVFGDGGYGSGTRVAFAVAAAAALVVVVAAGGRPSLRQPPVLVLIALAALGAASALWTVGPPSRALEWAMVTAGYAAVALAAAAAARRAGADIVAGGVAALAIAAAATGLIAAATFQAPYADRVAGVWRPGGPFEYAPALALLQVSALPALLGGMVHRSRVLAAAAAVGMGLAGGALALSGSRAGVAMAVAVAGGALVVSARRRLVGTAIALGVTAGTVLQIALGGSVRAGAPVDSARVAALAAVALLAAPVWLAARRSLGSRTPSPVHWPRPAALAVVVVAAVVAGTVVFGAAAGRGDGPAGGFLHGRTDTWHAAVLTFADRPLAGAGADAFLAGSARHQDGQTVLFAHDLPLELAAELGIAGLVLALALYAACAQALWRSRTTDAGRLLGPAVGAFFATSLVDWPWHLAGSGAVCALALGGLEGSWPRAANKRTPLTQGDQCTSPESRPQSRSEPSFSPAVAEATTPTRS
jgi:hypothetical protein